MSFSNTHSHKVIFDFAKLAGTQNFFIWQARMMDVLIREKLWDVVSGEKTRLANPDSVESDTSTDAARTQAQAKAAFTLINDDTDDGSTAESSTTAATRSKSATSKSVGSKPTGAKSSGAKSSDIDKRKGKEPATSTVVEFSPAIEKATEKQEEWDVSSTCVLSHIRGALTDAIVMTLGKFTTAHELWVYLQNRYGKVTTAELYSIVAKVRSLL
jgi:hypothetical protein